MAALKGDLARYRKDDTDLHPLFGDADQGQFRADRRWRRSVPRTCSAGPLTASRAAKPVGHFAARPR